MKKFIFTLFLLICFNNSFSQTNNLYVYETYQDFINNNSIDYGLATGYGMNLGKRYIVTKNNGQEKRIKTNKVWGFKIGDYLYRFCKKKNVPVSFLKNEHGICLYIEGDFTLRIAIWGVDYKKSTDHNNDGYFFSSNLESEILEISKIKKFKNKSNELDGFINCINEANKRYGDQAKFNGYTKCIFPNK